MERAVIITTDGDKSIVEFEKGNSYNLLRDTVGGLIQCVTLTDKWGVDMWLNEEGKVVSLPQNPIATALWDDLYPGTDFMVGNIILTQSDDEGETIGLTDEQIQFFMSYTRNLTLLGHL
jgi:hypothetical protein